jgi:putative Mn2+ efflux pump MntP
MGPSEKEINPLNVYVLLILSIATNIDALAIGVSFAFLKIFITTSIIVVGVVTFLLSFLSPFLGLENTSLHRLAWALLV